MANTYSTIQGDVVDLVCRRVYGDESGYVEEVLVANPGLAGMGPFLPIGTAIILPDLANNDEVPLVKLWD